MRHFRFFGLLLIAFCLLLPPWARAQNVRREDSPYGSQIRAADNAADKRNMAQWPHLLIDEAGTQVHVTFDLRNADVCLYTGYDFGVDRALQEARRIAPAIGYPNADYILNHGTHTLCADIELNKYLHRQDKSTTDFTLDLAALTKSLKASHLPQPIVLYIDGSDADSVTLHTAAGSDRRLGEAQFYVLSEVPAEATLNFQISLPCYAYLVAYGFVAFLGTMLMVGLSMPWWMAWKRIQKDGSGIAPPSALEPTEVQKRYNAGKPLWMTRLLPLTPLALMPSIANHRLLNRSMMVFPEHTLSPVMFLLPLLMLVSFGGSSALPALYRRFRKPPTMPQIVVPTPASAEAEQDETKMEMASTKPMMLLFIPLLAGMIFLPAMQFFPELRRFPSTVVIGTIFGVEVLAIVPAVVLMMRASQRTRRELVAGDPFFDEVQALATKAGVKVKHVIVTTSSSLNAYASVVGTIGVTSALLRKMEPDEVRAIVAHEIGHLKAGHPRRGFAIGLTILALYLTLIFGVLGHYESRMDPTAVALLRSPLPGILFGSLFAPLLLGKSQRRREVEADRFAVAMTGDAELVIRALRKLHTLSATPHMLKASDEALASHPSLAHRIEAIRASQPLP